MDHAPSWRDTFTAAVVGAAIVLAATAGGAAAQLCGGVACASSTDLVNGQVKAPDLGDASVGTARLAAGAVTSARVLDESLGEGDLSVGRRVVVAASGGDFSSVGAALAAISPGPSTPYVVEVLPGRYEESAVMKPYVHLRGAGPDLVILTSSTPDAGTIHIPSGTAHVTVSGLTVENTPLEGTAVFIEPDASAVTIQGNRFQVSGRGLVTFSPAIIRDNVFLANNGGLDIGAEAGATVVENTILQNGDGINFRSPALSTSVPARSTIALNDVRENVVGIDCFQDCIFEALANAITGNVVGVRLGIVPSAGGVVATISGNVITGNQGPGVHTRGTAAPLILSNRIDGNGSFDLDIVVEDGSAPHISWNVYDDISGTTGVGQFNLKPDGTPAPAP